MLFFCCYLEFDKSNNGLEERIIEKNTLGKKQFCYLKPYLINEFMGNK